MGAQCLAFAAAHKWAHSAFATLQHHVAGHKYVLHMLVKLPILAQCSAANPELCSTAIINALQCCTACSE